MNDRVVMYIRTGGRYRLVFIYNNIIKLDRGS